jgi:hypothetical protein
VTVQERSFSLGLAATAGVLTELTGCVRSSVALETPVPAKALSAPPPADAPLVQIPKSLVARDPTEVEEIKLARNFLAAAGLPNARLIDAEKPAALAKFTAVWRSDDAAGAVKIIPPGADVTAAGIASDLIAVDPKLCKGNFAAARSSDLVDGGVVWKAVLSCTEGGEDRTAQYLITPRQRGGFAVFAIIGNNGGNGGNNGRSLGADSRPAERLRPEVLGKAARRAVAPEG